jgi:Na+/melibiose symporter-like transporter
VYDYDCEDRFIMENLPRNKTNWFKLIAVNLFWLGLNMRNNAVGAIFLPFLVDRFAAPDLRNTALGGMRTAGLIIAMLVQPAAGILSDRSTSRFGRRRPFLALGVMLDLVGLIWIATADSYWSLLAAILFFQVANNVSHGPLQSLIPDLVPEDQRGRASAIKSIFELLPVVLLGITIAPLVAAGKFGMAVLVTALFLVTALLITLISVKEKPFAFNAGASGAPLGPALARVGGVLGGIISGASIGLLIGAGAGGLAYLLAMWAGYQEQARAIGIGIGGIIALNASVIAGAWTGVRLTLGNHDDPQRRKQFTAWVSNRLAFLAAITSIQGFAPFFLMYALSLNAEQAAGLTGTLFTLVGVFTLASALPAGWLADRIGTVRLTALSGFLAAIGALILLGAVWKPELWIINTAGVILGLATGLFVTVNWALGTRLVPESESGRWLGISNLAGAGAGMVGSGIGGPLADQLNGFVPGLGYFTIFAGYASLFLLSAACLWPLRKIPRGV